MTHVFQTDARENAKKTEFHLQDYNRSVLELITMPNIIMAWCECRECVNSDILSVDIV